MGLTAYRCRLFTVLAISGLALAMPNIVHAQKTPEKNTNVDDIVNQQPLDPDQPLTEFPDFGVEWPDLDAPEDEETGKARISEGSSSEIADGDVTNELDLDNQVSVFSGETFAQEIAENFQPDDVLAQSSYRIVFAGLPDTLSPFFRTRFRSLSALEQHKDDEANFAQIKRRAETDRELVEQLLQIEGYYDAIARMDFASATATADPNDVIITIETVSGPQYRLDAIALDGLSKASGDDPMRFREVFGLESGDIINSDRIVLARSNLDRAMAEGGYPFAETGEPDLLIDHAQRNGDLAIDVNPGGQFAFGAIVMRDELLFGPGHVQQIARFDRGDLFRQSDVEDLRRALIATGLVSTISLEPVVSKDPGKVDLAVDLTPAPLRTISGAVGYGTGEGARAEVSWEHRNFFPPEGLIRLTGVVATQEQSGSITFRRSNFRRRDNVLNGRVALSNIDRAAFEARTFSVGANIERQSNLIYQKRWNWSAGVEFLASQERDISGGNLTSGRDIFFIGSLPATLTYDASDNLLDPASGFRLGARISPEASLQSGSFFYARSQIDGSAYLPVSDKLVVAGRVRLGSIVGAGNNRIAPSRRLYSGGGGSVRGFGFQRIGPRDVNNDPVGGRSLAEFALEARVRVDLFGDRFGIVPFIDAGNVYTESLPDFSGLRYGAGVGVRYYSDFGPIRVDVGTPINPQPGDARVAVYVSLGQAF